MATGQRKDPFRNFRFRVEIDGIQQAGFSEVSGFDSSVDVIEYREGSDPPHVRKLTGLAKAGNVTLKWGITDSLDLYKWHKNFLGGNGEVKNLAIILMDEAGNDKARWELVRAWPSRYHSPDLNAKGNEVAIETLELVCEELSRVS